MNSFREYPEVAKQLKSALNSSNEDICRNAMDAAKTLGNAENLPSLRHLAETIIVVERPLEAIASIQANCQFYNYEIWQAHLEAQKGDNSASQTSSSPSTTNSVIYDLRGAAIANLAHEVHGNQITQPEKPQ